MSLTENNPVNCNLAQPPDPRRAAPDADRVHSRRPHQKPPAHRGREFRKDFDRSPPRETAFSGARTAGRGYARADPAQSDRLHAGKNGKAVRPTPPPRRSRIQIRLPPTSRRTPDRPASDLQAGTAKRGRTNCGDRHETVKRAGATTSRNDWHSISTILTLALQSDQARTAGRGSTPRPPRTRDDPVPDSDHGPLPGRAEQVVTFSVDSVHEVAGRASAAQCCERLPRGGRVFGT
jgi:hypothetical protein